MAKYVMRISRLTVDKLGVKLYDKVSAVIAELVANSYDADAENVYVHAPMGEFLASKAGGAATDKGYTIEVADDGVGMTPDEVNDFYLRVGAERRLDTRRGDKSRKFQRKVMGRKGVGKLAPFGICNKIEVITAGGELTKGLGRDGKEIEGYLTAHLVMDRNSILSDDEADYEPAVGSLDGIVQPSSGTTVRLSDFYYRSVPKLDDFSRQLAQRFGIRREDWRVFLKDNTKTDGSEGSSCEVGEFQIETMENTKIVFRNPTDTSQPTAANCPAIGPDGNPLSNLRAGFECDGHFYPVSGWIAYSKSSYKDDLMAGVRIYCRGKIASQTGAFDIKAGFTGEHTVRSYLVGELQADWLDEGEDLIQTDRRDLLWSHELGRGFQEWGQLVIRRLGTLSRDPMRKKLLVQFMEVSKAEERVQAEYPGGDLEPIRENALHYARILGQKINAEELKDQRAVDSLLDLALVLAPHVTLDKKLREAVDETASPLCFVVNLLKTAKVAELSAFGRIAADRVRVIEKVIDLKDTPGTVESEFQELIEAAPWLINPQWSPITSNQSMETLKEEFAKYYKEKTGQDIVLSSFSLPSKRPDFVLS
ncbi:MAG: ATP-binding protein, partial [Desulfovibrionaceae bacterium]